MESTHGPDQGAAEQETTLFVGDMLGNSRQVSPEELVAWEAHRVRDGSYAFARVGGHRYEVAVYGHVIVVYDAAAADTSETPMVVHARRR